MLTISPGSWSYQDYLQTTNWSRPEIARIHSVFLWLKPLHVSCASFFIVLLAREDLGNKDAVEFFTAAELRSGRTRIQAERHVWAHRLPQQQNEREDTNSAGSVWRFQRVLQAEALNSTSVMESEKYGLNLFLRSQVLILDPTHCLTLIEQMRLLASVMLWM